MSICLRFLRYCLYESEVDYAGIPFRFLFDKQVRFWCMSDQWRNGLLFLYVIFVAFIDIGHSPLNQSI